MAKKKTNEELLIENKQLKAKITELEGIKSNSNRWLEMASKAEIAANLGSWSWVVSNKYVVWSDNMCRLHGIEPSEYKSTFEHASSFHHPDDRSYVNQQIEKMLAEKKSRPFEYRIITPSGIIKTLEGINQLHFNKKGDIIEIVGTVQDITEKKKIEEIIKDSEHKFKTIFEESTDGIFLMDEASNILEVNNRSCEILGYSKEELIGIKGNSLIHPVDAMEIPYGENLHKTLQGKTVNSIYRLIKKDGTFIYAELSSKLFTTRIFLNIIRDISEQKLAEQALQESEIRFRELVSNMNSGVAIYKVINNGKSGSDYIIQDFNKYALEHEQLDKESIIGKSLKDIRPNIDDYGLIDVFRKVWKTGKAAFFPATVYVDEKYNNHYENRVFRIPSDEIVAIYDDVSEKEYATAQLKLNKERFDLAMSASKDGLYDWNLETNEIYYSPGWKKMLGYEDDELPNDFSIWEKLTETKDVEKSWEMQQEVINKQRNRFKLEFKMKHKDGHWVDILSRAEAIFNDSGKAIRIVGTHVDISELKKAEGLILKNKTRLDYALRSIKTGAWELDLKTLNTWRTPEHDYIFGYNEPLQEFTYDTFLEHVIPEDREIVNEKFQKSLSNKTDWNFECRIHPKVGGVRWIWANGNQEFNKDPESVKMFGIVQDITERKLAEERIRISETNLKNTFDISPSIICKADIVKGYFIEVNQAVERILGYSVEEFTSRPIIEFTHPDDRQKTEHEFEKQLKGSEVKSFENRYLSKNGSYIWMAWYSTNANKDGIVTAIGVDVNARKIGEQKIIETKQFYEDIIEGVQDGIWVTDKNDVIFYANTAMEKIEGVTLEQIQGKNVLTNFHKETSEEFVNFYKLAKKGNVPLWYDLKVKTLSGKNTWQNGWLIPQYKDKAFSGIICTIRDVTKRKQAEGSVRRLSSAILQSPSIIAITDTQGKLEYVNPNFTELTGFKSAEAIGQNPNILKSGVHNDNFYKNLWKTISAGKVWRGQFRNKKKNGELFWEAASISAIKNKSGEIISYIKIGEDISKQKNTEIELNKALKKAVESDQLKSAFLSNMSHEIRTPMNGILGFLDLINKPDISKSQVTEYSAIIHKSSDRLLKTINDIIDISKIEAGETVITNEPISINNLLNELHSFHSSEATQKGLSFAIKPIHDREQTTIISDNTKLHGILTNLLKNAIKYTEKGHVTFGYLMLDGFIEFFVKDTGIGIPKDRIKAIFNRFEQADLGEQRGYEGSGLGLAISKAYVEMLGGEIKVGSEEGKGSIFSFTIPCNSKAEELSKKYSENISTVTTNLKKLNLLIVEDDDISSKYLQIILDGLFRKIKIAKDGIEAIEICKFNPVIDLVLMDIQLPDMSGYDVTRAIRKFNKDLIIIAQTAFALAGDREKALEAGCNDYIPKPINKKILLEKISKSANNLKI